MSRTITETQISQFRILLIEDEKSNATVAKYVRDVKTFKEYIMTESITKEAVVGYKKYLIEHYAPTSVNSMLASINCFFKTVGWHDCVVKSMKIQRQAFRPKDKELTKQEYYRLLDAAKAKRDIRLWLLMQTICGTGIRVSELEFITLEAARKGRAVVSLKGKTRMVLLPTDLCRKLMRYAKEQNIGSGSIFITRTGKPLDRRNILHAMKELCKMAKVDRKKVFPHNLRHLFACLYYKAVKDISRLADLLGHTSVNTTRIYTSVSGEEQVREIGQLGLVI